MYRFRINIKQVPIAAAACFFLICYFKSFWYLSGPNIFLRAMMFLGAGLAFACSKPKNFAASSRNELIWAIVIVVPIMSRVLRAYHGNGISETLGFTTFYLCSVVYAFSCARNKKLINASFKVMAVYLAVLVACTIVFRFTPNFYLSRILTLFSRDFNLRRGYLAGHMSGLTSHYSTNAIYMATAAIATLCLCITAPKNKTYKLLFLLSAAALLMTGKRGQFIFAVAACLAGYYYYMSDKPKGRAFKLSVLLVAIVVIMYLGAMLFPTLFGSVSRMISKWDSDDMTTGRILLWGQAIEYFKAYPLFGIGFKQFLRITGFDVHNIYLQFLCETGVLGTAVYLTALISSFSISVSNVVSARKKHLFVTDSEDEFNLLFCVAYQVFFLSYGLTGNPFYDLPSLMPYLFSVGIGLYYRREIRNIKSRGAANA